MQESDSALQCLVDRLPMLAKIAGHVHHVSESHQTLTCAVANHWQDSGRKHQHVSRWADTILYCGSSQSLPRFATENRRTPDEAFYQKSNMAIYLTTKFPIDGPVVPFPSLRLMPHGPPKYTSTPGWKLGLRQRLHCRRCAFSCRRLQYRFSEANQHRDSDTVTQKLVDCVETTLSHCVGLPRHNILQQGSKVVCL